MHNDFSYARLAACYNTPMIADTVRSADCLLGILTSVASAPALLTPEDWLELIFRDDIDENELPDNPSEEFDVLLQELIHWWFYCMSCFREGKFSLPGHLAFDDNGSVPQALKEFAEGYVIACEWSDDLWEAVVTDEDGMESGLRMAALTAMAQCVKEDLRKKAGMPDLVARMVSAQTEDQVSDSALTLENLLYSVGNVGLALSEDSYETPEPYINPNRDVGRNDPCPCGSGKKFKKCCMQA